MNLIDWYFGLVAVSLSSHLLFDAEGPPGEVREPELWLDQDPADYGEASAEPDKGADKGASGRRRASKRPDLSSDRAETGGFGTAYRIRTDDLRLERAVS